MSLRASQSPVSVGQSRRHFGALALAVAAVMGSLCGSPVRSQTAPATAPATPSMIVAPTAPASATAPVSAATAPAATAPTASILPLPAPATAPTTAPAADVAAVTQPFVAAVTGDNVNIRSGPDTKYYEIGKLNKGDLVYVVGLKQGWYQILAPNGAFCLVAKEFVELDAATHTGTLKGDNVNVHAGSAIYKESDYAILPPTLRKGAKVKVLGSTDKYYQIAPTETTYFFIKTDFVKAAPGAEYKVAQLKLPPNVTGPTGITVEAPTTLPTAVAVEDPRGIVTLPPASAGTSEPPLPVPAPRVTYSATALTRFNEANAKFQEESRKAPAQQNLDALLAEFNAILALDNLAPSVKAGAQANLTAIERTLAVQRLIKDQTAATEATKAQSDALRQQYDAAEKALAAAREAGPYTAEGILQTSTVVTGKYALVNPKSGRVVAYIDPANADVDIGVLVGKYVGVRGITKTMEGSEITLIQVNNASLIPQPK